MSGRELTEGIILFTFHLVDILNYYEYVIHIHIHVILYKYVLVDYIDYI